MQEEEIITTFKKLGIKPKKYLGQNFLINKAILSDILAAAEIKAKDKVLEIGPGLGILTEKLAEITQNSLKSQKLSPEIIAVEKDAKFAKILEKKFKNQKNIKIIEDDILKFDPGAHNLEPKSYKITANLPYYITSPIIRKFLENPCPPKLMVLMVQKEVAQRICAAPPDMTLLSVSVQFYAAAEIIKIVEKENFWPEPKVDGAIIKISNLKSQISKFDKDLFLDKDLFFKIVKSGFSNPRKQLKNNLKGIAGERTSLLLKTAKIDETRRAETLSIQEWKNICLIFKNIVK